MKLIFVVVIRVLAVWGFCGVSSAAEVEQSASIHWLSKHLAEGRNQIPGSDLMSIDYSWVNSNIEVGAFYGAETSNPLSSKNYQQWNVWTAFTYPVGNFDIAASYQYEYLSHEQTHSNEWGIAITGHHFDQWVPALSYRYSVQDSAGYAEFSLTNIQPLTTEYEWSTFVLLGVNNGYVVDEREGMDNVQLGTVLNYVLSSAVLVSAQLTQSWAVNRDSSVTIDDALWLDVGFSYRF